MKLIKAMTMKYFQSFENEILWGPKSIRSPDKYNDERNILVTQQICRMQKMAISILYPLTVRVEFPYPSVCMNEYH